MPAQLSRFVPSIAKLPIFGLALVSLTALAPVSSQAATLSFDQLVGTADGYTRIGKSDVAQTSTVRFTNVATDAGKVVDAQIVATIKANTDFAETGKAGSFGDAGYIPDYQPSGTNVGADLGFLYYGNGINTNENGISLAFTFYDGTDALSGTFNQRITVAELNFAIYDVDGESVAKGGNSTQSEFFRAFVSDGLQSYQLGNTAQALTATRDGGTVTFRGPDKNFAENDASGAAVLTYKNTDSFMLDFGSVQSSGSKQNGVFSAFDGDLSLIDRSTLGPEVPTVPLPSSLPLLATAIGAAAMVLRRKNRS